MWHPYSNFSQKNAVIITEVLTLETSVHKENCEEQLPATKHSGEMEGLCAQPPAQASGSSAFLRALWCLTDGVKCEE